MRHVLLALLLTTALCSAQSLDRVQNFAKAVAKAEGFYKRGTIPYRCSNPGDLKTVRGWKYPGQIGVCKGGHVRFKNTTLGWAALTHKIEKIADGESRRFDVNMTLKEFGKAYAGNWRVWSKNVAHNLGVDTDTQLWEVLDVPPILPKETL